MADLKTSYMGIDLKNPIIVGACSLSKQVDHIKAIEQAGAGGLVIKSIFEEQIQLERSEFETELSNHNALYAEAVELFPKIEHGGAKQHLFWVSQTRKAVSMPLFASINAINDKTWPEYAEQLEDTGVDGIELNFYSLPLDTALKSSDIENKELEIFSSVRQAVKVPIAVKLHPYYTNLAYQISAFDKLGANAIVLFNRLFQPDIDIENQKEHATLVLSDSSDSRISLRWTALLYQKINADLVANTGIMTGEDVIKAILTGANAVQVVSTLYKNKIPYLSKMLDDLSAWMDQKGYTTLDDFRGSVSKKNVKDPWGFERAQYIKALLGFD